MNTFRLGSLLMFYILMYYYIIIAFTIYIIKVSRRKQATFNSVHICVQFNKASFLRELENACAEQ